MIVQNFYFNDKINQNTKNISYNFDEKNIMILL